jgi:hypothetical protein
MQSHEKDEFRQCLNIKSRKNPDTQCTLSAIQGEYCSRHTKNPRPFRAPKKIESHKVITRSDVTAIRRIQKFWRTARPLYMFKTQGPAVHCKSIATNQTELYTLDPIEDIPPLYFISVSDARKCIWAFDIRSIVPTMASGAALQNPYTRDVYTEDAKERIHNRIEWLRSRKYQILHATTEVFTPAQIWNHKVLDVFLKIEALGYYASCDWYTSFGLYDHILFYKRLFTLWEWRLGLTRLQKELIVPGYMTKPNQLFRFDPTEVPPKSLHWWERTNLALVERFLTSVADKEQNKLGAMYVLMAMTHVSSDAAEAMPWLLVE